MGPGPGHRSELHEPRCITGMAYPVLQIGYGLEDVQQIKSNQMDDLATRQTGVQLHVVMNAGPSHRSKLEEPRCITRMAYPVPQYGYDIRIDETMKQQYFHFGMRQAGNRRTIRPTAGCKTHVHFGMCRAVTAHDPNRAQLNPYMPPDVKT